MEFFTKESDIFYQGKKVNIKGVNWFGMETSQMCPHGLWSVSMSSVFDFLVKNSFNAIRLPFSTELALNMDTLKCESINTAENPSLANITAGKMMDIFINECKQRGILVLLDMHRLKGSEGITELWYNNEFTEDLVIKAWLEVVKRYTSFPNVFAVDLKNEPHGIATWGGDSKTDWASASERIGNAILKVNPKLLIFVEGVQTGPEGENTWWGGSLTGVHKRPIKLSVDNKVVYSPHVYGPDVHLQPYFEDKDFPKNLRPIWERQWAFLKTQNKGACVIGEWGGFSRDNTKDKIWQEELASFLNEKGMHSWFYWCVNPNSGDTGGLLAEDWKTPIQNKLVITTKACPSPTKFDFNVTTPVKPDIPTKPQPQPITPTKPDIPLQPNPSSSMEFYAKDKNIYLGNQKVNIKGLNWFGMETDAYCPHALWQVSISSLFDFITKNGFNAIRLPFTTEFALGLDTLKCTTINYSLNPQMKDWTAGQMMDFMLAECNKRGIAVLLSMHRFTSKGEIPELWYDNDFSENKVIDAWKKMIQRYKKYNCLFGIDLKNEPHGKASWGDGNISTDWARASERISLEIHKISPRLLIFVEGISRCLNGDITWWGGSLEGVQNSQIKLSVQNKLVYSPHVYGPDVFPMSHFKDSNFPSNMNAIWEKEWAYIHKKNLGTVVIGEWGGRNRANTDDRKWHDAVSKYFVANGYTNTFYWCLNPNGGDTGGVLDQDWKTPIMDKLNIIRNVCPNPTKFNFQSSQPQQSQPQQPKPQPQQPQPQQPQPQQPQPQQPQPQQPKPQPNGNGLKLVVKQTNKWMDGTTECVQEEVEITNTSTQKISTMKLKVGCNKIHNFWNCLKRSSNENVFDFPQWVVDKGGIDPNETIKIGFVISGNSSYTI